MRKSPSVETYKLLYVRSGNECAFPKCNHPIFNDEGLYIAQLCHIKAANKGGPRYDEFQNDDERRSIENLLFMCHRHHKETDNSEDYPVKVLTSIKTKHEQKYTEEGRRLSADMVNQIEYDSRYYWNRQKNKEFELDELKMKTNFDFNETELFKEMEEAISLIYNYCETCAISDDVSTLERDLRKLLEKAGLDYSKIEKIPYYENPFSRRNWEFHNIGLPNLFSNILMKLYQLRVKAFETAVKANPKNEELKFELERYKKEFEEIYDDSYHVD